MKKARVIEITKFGPPEVLQVKEEILPEPARNEVRIDVKAVGLNFADVFERLGLYAAAPKAPFVPGFEVAGVIDSVGEDVPSYDPGDRVFAVTHFGGYKSCLNLSADFVRPLPDDYSFEEGAGFPTTYLTAYHGMLNLAHIKQKESLLIHAAAGGVGTAAIQIAQIFDAEIFATCGSEAKVQFLKTLGEFQIINYREEDFAKVIRQKNNGSGVDIVMDSVGGKSFRKGYELLNPLGRLIIFGLGDMMPARRRNWLKLAWKYLTLPRFNPFDMIPDNKTVAGFHLAYMFDYVDLFDASITELLTWANQGRLKPIIGRVFPFGEAAAAQRFLQSRQSVGKVILKV